MAIRSWLQTALFGVRQLLDDGDVLPERGALNFIGATITDDPALKQTNIEFPTSAILAAATKNATPNTLPLRGASGEADFGGTCNFDELAASTSITAPAAAFTMCDADVITASTSVTCPLFESSGAGRWGSASKTANTIRSGNALFGSGNTSGNTANTGLVIVSSGDVAGTLGTSGAVSVVTGTGTAASGASGNILIKTGGAYYASGSIAITTGDTAQNIGVGPIGIQGGAALGTGRGGSVAIAGGGSSGGTELGGDVTLAPGVGAGGVGGISLGSATPDFQDGEGAIFIADCAVKPTTAPAGGVLLYSFAGVLFVMDGAGVETQLTP